MKECARCEISKPLDEFNYSSRGAHNRQRYCRTCQSQHYKTNDRKYKEQARLAKRYRTGAKYGLSKEQTDAFYARNGGMCELCNRRAGFHLDHDHVTLEIRGLLCMQCNTGLGKLGDTVEDIENALHYLTSNG